MATLSDENRQVVHQALAVNYAALRFAYGDQLSTETNQNVAEMVVASSGEYNPENLNFVGDTLDRHSYSCYGNLGEVVTMMTLLKHDYVHADDVWILRSIEDQVTTKADIAAGNVTYQVKTATFGTGGQLFVAEHELVGTATYMAYVDAQGSKVFLFSRGDFRRDMKEQKDIGGPYDRWWNKSGWFITPEDCDFIDQLVIPPGVAAVYFDNQTLRTIIT